MRTSWCATRGVQKTTITPLPYSSHRALISPITAAAQVGGDDMPGALHRSLGVMARCAVLSSARSPSTPSPRNHCRSYRYPPNADHRAHNRGLYAERGVVAVSGRFAPSHASESHTHAATRGALFLFSRAFHAKPHLRLAISTLICHALLSCNSRATLQRCLRLRARGGSGRRRRVAAPAASQHDDNAVVMSALHTAVLWWVLYSGRLCRAAAAGHDWSFVDITRGAALSLPRCASAHGTPCVTQPHGHHAHLGRTAVNHSRSCDELRRRCAGGQHTFRMRIIHVSFFIEQGRHHANCFCTNSRKRCA